jgi:hypothetical protein
MISGCFWSGPWPSVTVNTEGLGAGPLAQFIGRNTYYTADELKRITTKFVIEQTSAKGISRDAAEALGMQCAPAPSKECSYSGEYWVRSDQRYVREVLPTTEQEPFITSTCGSLVRNRTTSSFKLLSATFPMNEQVKYGGRSISYCRSATSPSRWRSIWLICRTTVEHIRLPREAWFTEMIS